METHREFSAFNPVKEHWTAYIERACYYFIANDVKTNEKKRVNPSKNYLARKMEVLQDLALNLASLELNLASLELKLKLFLQELKNLALILQELARKNCKIIFLQDICKTCIFLASLSLLGFILWLWT